MDVTSREGEQKKTVIRVRYIYGVALMLHVRWVQPLASAR